MIIIAPANQPYGSALLSGWSQTDDIETRMLAVILKAAYDIQAGSPGIMVPSDDSARLKIRFQDSGTHIFTDTTNARHIIPAKGFQKVTQDEAGNVIPPSFQPEDVDKVYFKTGSNDLLVENEVQNLEFELLYEADVALEKARTDIVVEGYLDDATGGAVALDGDIWLKRNIAIPGPDQDSNRNLFGWQPRTQAERNSGISINFNPETDGNLPTGFSSQHNNFHRNGEDFSFSSQVSPELPSRTRVDIYKNKEASGIAYSFTLPELELSARYRFHDGTRPDHEYCWKHQLLGPMPADTLIVSPDENKATILWRISWPADAQAMNAYRRVEITRGVN